MMKSCFYVVMFLLSACMETQLSEDHCYYSIKMQKSASVSNQDNGSRSNFEKSVTINDHQISKKLNWKTSSYDDELLYVENSCDVSELEGFLNQIFPEESYIINPVTEAVYDRSLN